MTSTLERYISVDIEAAGPIPGEYSMLTIGACLVDAENTTFQASVKPLNRNVVPEAMQVSGLSMEELERSGQTPAAAMSAFSKWIEGATHDGARAVFVGFNAPFDWSFVNYYFHRFLGSNPFGFAALDIKALYMGVTGCTWEQTTSSQIAKQLNPKRRGTHDALEDAKYQAELFRLTRGLSGH